MEEFAQSSGDAGIVVFTLGSMIHNISSAKANMIASGLAQIPQKVSVFVVKLLTAGDKLFKRLNDQCRESCATLLTDVIEHDFLLLSGYKIRRAVSGFASCV